MPQVSDVRGTAAVISPALTKKAERLIGSATETTSGSFPSSLTTKVFAFKRSRLRSSITRKGRKTILQASVKKKATRITDLIPK